ncbi:endonuclease VIII [Aliifodinibius salipaludis]|uniref:DNA-(apurinic or apyrimidinic site) lyase n=1 Tax=Fodinibius salipaludis TaxID=2032627 RepID=A0A2A2GAK2_9BACT|nr:endonuclease VIII [Aliifodinibius salipaludis]PAU93879.1 endonuclease VIII [Aliifodinibius salipaludis]
MPEGPEIWRTADSLTNALKNRPIEDLYFAFDELKNYEAKLKGQFVENVEARGKALLTFFDNNKVMYSHNQLYGKWMVSDSGEQPDTNRSLRVAIHNGEKSAYLYSASEIEMLDREEVNQHSYIKKLGPDVLHPDTTYEDILRQYQSDEFKNRKLTTLLLDQGFVSGIGNYLRSEIMFYAKVNPRKKLRAYSDQQKASLAEATFKLTTRSYKTGGITNDPEIVEALKRENAPRSDYRHFVYNRTDDHCHKCGSIIEEEKNGGRKIYFCSNCQLET